MNSLCGCQAKELRPRVRSLPSPSQGDARHMTGERDHSREALSATRVKAFRFFV